MRPGPVPDHAAQHVRWRQLEARLAALERSAGVAPLVDADPAEDSPIRLWRMTDGRLRWRDAAGQVHQAAEATPGPPTSTPLPVPATPTTRTGQWTATWSATYPDGEVGAFGAGVRLMLGFGPEVGHALVDAVAIDEVRVLLFSLEGDAEVVRTGIGHHGATAPPQVYEGTAPISRVDLPRVGSPGWRRIHRSIGQAFAEGTAAGLVIDQAATGDERGRLAVDAGRAPRLQITYRM